jgi:uncharacterized protein YndB with AHSA1/START domain
MSTNTSTDRGITVVRRLDAPREVVFRAWTEPEHLGWFLGPGHTDRPITVDLRVGGQWRLHMVENEERHYMTGGIYREITPPERLVFTWGAVDGWPLLDADRPDEGLIATITLADVGGGVTEMTCHLGFPDHFTDEQVKEWLALGVRGGWTDTIDRLAPYLAGDHG